MKYIFIVLLFLCSGLQASSVENSKGSKMEFVYTFSQNFPPEAITIKKGESATFLLETQLGTGYDWIVKPPIPSFLELINDSTISDNASVLGGKGSHLFKFQAIQKGNGVLTFQYKRSWEKDIAPLKVLEIEMRSE